jgi:transcriptional regulator with XRE-family HTH domain
VIPWPRTKASKSQHKLFGNIIGQRLRRLRDAKKLTQGDLEKRSGLLRCAISRLENGHTVPALHTLEKLAQALRVPLFRMFTDDSQATKPHLPRTSVVNNRHNRELRRFAIAFKRLDDRDRKILLAVAQKMAERNAKE